MHKCKMHAAQHTARLCEKTAAPKSREVPPLLPGTTPAPKKALLKTHLALLPANVSCILPCQETPHVRIPCASHAPVLEVVMTDAKKNPLSSRSVAKPAHAQAVKRFQLLGGADL
jgi:hypothetical protein